MYKKGLLIMTLISNISLSNQLFSPLIEKALELAAQWHENTYRRDQWRTAPFNFKDNTQPKTPVLMHLTSVGFILQRAGFDDVTVAAGILHDIIEDGNKDNQTFSYEQLKQHMGVEIADIVMNLSETKTDNDGNKLSWKIRKDEYLEKLSSAPLNVLAISLADKIHNLWSFNQGMHHGVTHFKADPKEQIWFYSSVLNLAKKHKTDKRIAQLIDEFEAQLDQFKSAIEQQ
ncbi:MAG: HD domain-containing protein [Candidatus Dependentiae bacterium]